MKMLREEEYSSQFINEIIADNKQQWKLQD